MNTLIHYVAVFLANLASLVPQPRHKYRGPDGSLMRL